MTELRRQQSEQKPPLSRFFFRIILILFALIITTSFVRTIWSSRQALQRIKAKEQEVLKLEAETKALEEKLEQATSSFELERRTRETLDLQKPGEQIYKIE